MIKEMKPLTLAESQSLAKTHGANEEIVKYFKQFMNLKEKDSVEMRKELEDLDNHKIRNEHVVKIVDLLPEDSSDLNKIFTEISLDENEIKQITDIVKKHK
jgi:DNA-directed RNA polymerase subunit F